MSIKNRIRRLETKKEELAKWLQDHPHANADDKVHVRQQHQQTLEELAELEAELDMHD